jgi:hypothetical protein
MMAGHRPTLPYPGRRSTLLATSSFDSTVRLGDPTTSSPSANPSPTRSVGGFHVGDGGVRCRSDAVRRRPPRAILDRLLYSFRLWRFLLSRMR